MKKLFVSLMILCLSAGAVLAGSYTPINIIRILDGDTVEAEINNNKFKIRLIGIDCYETGKITRAYKQAYTNNISIDEVTNRGIKSKVYLEDLYTQNQNKQVSLDFKGLDIYGRVLGIIYFDNLNVNQDLIKNGGCMVYEFKEH